MSTWLERAGFKHVGAQRRALAAKFAPEFTKRSGFTKSSGKRESERNFAKEKVKPANDLHRVSAPALFSRLGDTQIYAPSLRRRALL